MRKKAIVTDVDQVLLDYYSRLREYVNSKYGRLIEGLPEDWDLTSWLQCADKLEMLEILTEFSTLKEFGTLDAFPGADVVLHELIREGYSIICLTACGTRDITKALREVNLFHRFGDIFEEIHFVGFDDGKVDTVRSIQERYDVVAFIDDKPQNIMDIYFELDMDNIILMKSPHNREWRQTGYKILSAFSWYECKQIINGWTE